MCGLCSQVCGYVLHMRRLENDIECSSPFSALLFWDSKLEACCFSFVCLFWLCSKLSGLSTPPPHSSRVCSHAWLFMWAQGIQTQYLMLRDQLFLPTEPPLQSLVEVLKEASHLHHGPWFLTLFQTYPFDFLSDWAGPTGACLFFPGFLTAVSLPNSSPVSEDG